MFKKSSYSDLEVQEILQSLFQEKKKVSELELKFKNSLFAPASTPTSDHYKSEWEALRLKCKELQQDLAFERESNRLLKSKMEQLPAVDVGEKSEPHETQFENIIQFLRKKTEEAQGEIQTLLKKISLHEETANRTQAELTALQEAQAKLLEALKKEQAQKADIEEEEASLKSQMKQLKVEIGQLQESTRQREEENQALHKKCQDYEANIFHTGQQLELAKKAADQSFFALQEGKEKENASNLQHIQSLKDELANVQKEAHEKHAELQQQYKINATLQQTIEENHKQFQAASSLANAQILAHQELSQLVEELKKDLATAEEEKNLALEKTREKESLNASLQAQIGELTRSLRAAESSLEQLASEREEEESRLRVSQQHLAKKVRETNTLSEKNEELRLRTQEMEHLLENSKTKIIEMQSSLDTQSKHQKVLQEQFHEHLKTVETQAKKWEEKYFQMHEKWQEGEGNMQELKRLKERFVKLQQVLNHLNSILGASFAPDFSMPELPSQSKQTEQVPSPCVTIQPSLFDASKQSARFKETLFG